MVEASAAPWEQPVEAAPLVFLDLEMTGLDPEADRICEVCALRCRGRQLDDAIDSLVEPGVAQGEGQAIHGIDQAQLAGAPRFAELGPRLWSLLDGAFLVAHGSALDVAFLGVELGRIGLSPPWVGVLDTVPMARRCLASRSYQLGALSRTLGLEHPRLHRAGDDARATQQLFWLLVELLAPASVADLANVRVGEGVARPRVLDLAQEAVEGARPVLVRYRPTGRPPEEFAFVFTAVRTDMDPPRAMGYLHPGRGRKELRADRILAILPLPPAGSC